MDLDLVYTGAPLTCTGRLERQFVSYYYLTVSKISIIVRIRTRMFAFLITIKSMKYVVDF
jgi:hypothetical protein